MIQTASPADTYNVVFGCGALDHSWWLVNEFTMASGVWRARLTCGEGDEDDVVATITHTDIMRWAHHVVRHRGKMIHRTSARTGHALSYRAWSLDLETDCTALIFNVDNADFDSSTADELVQLAVRGEVTFG